MFYLRPLDVNWLPESGGKFLHRKVQNFCRGFVSGDWKARSKWGQAGRQARLVPVQIKFPAVRAQLNSCRKTPRVGTGSKRQQSLLPRHFSSSRACSAQRQLCIKHNLSFEAGWMASNCWHAECHLYPIAKIIRYFLSLKLFLSSWSISFFMIS